MILFFFFYSLLWFSSLSLLFPLLLVATPLHICCLFSLSGSSSSWFRLECSPDRQIPLIISTLLLINHFFLISVSFVELSTHCGQNYLDTWFLHVYIDRFECNYMSIIKPGLWCWTQSQSYQYIIWTYPFFRILGVFQSYCKYYLVVCKLSCLLCLFIIQFLLLTPVYCFTFTVSV